jgi:hypothetical protein
LRPGFRFEKRREDGGDHREKAHDRAVGGDYGHEAEETEGAFLTLSTEVLTGSVPKPAGTVSKTCSFSLKLAELLPLAEGMPIRDTLL